MFVPIIIKSFFFDEFIQRLFKNDRLIELIVRYSPIVYNFEWLNILV